ncbi:HNH endonuclease [Chitinophaga sp. 22620]|uniref:HNH endonuclease n=1 Tax=Chitinophaga sp. 22620 TaxID=3453952 RepID=UPI003F850468
MKRNPKWSRDEIILALDLYFSPNRGSIDKKNPKIIALSRLLRELPIVFDRPDSEKFRNANGVALKLSNFAKFDSGYTGKGMRNASKLDGIIFHEFVNQKEKLKKIAEEIRTINKNSELRVEILAVEDDEQTENDAVFEGSIIYKLHKTKERSLKIVKKKKEQVLKETGKLTCEICEFDFQLTYGDIGRGFIECHHRTPLSSLKASTKTSLNDLALVCANCHRMLHRRTNSTVEDLRINIH